MRYSITVPCLITIIAAMFNIYVCRKSGIVWAWLITLVGACIALFLEWSK